MAHSETLKRVNSVEAFVALLAEPHLAKGSESPAITSKEIFLRIVPNCSRSNLEIWLHRGAIPAKYYIAHSELIRSHDAEPDPALWGMIIPGQSGTAEQATQSA